jgi:flagellar hook-length control protein FliK
VQLSDAAESVRTTIAMSVRAGVSQARINLAPASLGAIQIRLQRTPDGVIARVTADHPEAARALAQNSDDLRRSFRDSGTTLLRLDIESSDQGDDMGEDHTAGSTSGDGFADGDSEADPISTDLPTTPLSDAALVNVLA